MTACELTNCALGRSSVSATRHLSTAARQRLLSRRGEPLFVASWDRVLMVHFEVAANDLRREVPFELDLWEGRAFVSLVGFTMRGLRPRFGGPALAWLFRPVGIQRFLNVRTYVRHHGETGILFLAEWLDNPLSVRLGPLLFGLPYRLGRLDYEHGHETGKVAGNVWDSAGQGGFTYEAELPVPFGLEACPRGSLDEFLMERYTAFTCGGGKRRFLRVWHRPWLQCDARVALRERSLLDECWPWFGRAKLLGANYAAGASEVWMGWPHRCRLEGNADHEIDRP